MKLQPKYIKEILYGVGVLILLIVIAVIKPSLDEKHDALKATNDQLAAQVTQLEQLEANAPTYEAKTKEFQEEDALILNEYPAEVRAEDVILYARQIEDKSDMTISSVGLTQANLLYAMNAAADAAAAPAAEDTAADGTTDTQAAEAAADAAVSTASGFDAALGVLDEASVVKPDYNLFQMPVSYDIKSSYRDLKKIISDILSDPDKQNVAGLSLTYDEESGNLVGNMNINRYYVTGTEKQYQNPDAGNIKKGTNNIFGTVESPVAE